jgi:hypothetical protein
MNHISKEAKLDLGEIVKWFELCKIITFSGEEPKDERVMKHYELQVDLSKKIIEHCKTFKQKFLAVRNKNNANKVDEEIAKLDNLALTKPIHPSCR